MIRIEPGEVRDTGGRIKRKKEELEEIIKDAKRKMDSLREGFKGKRSDKIYGRWEQIYPDIQKSFVCLEEAGRLLETAASDFEQVDNA